MEQARRNKEVMCSQMWHLIQSCSIKFVKEAITYVSGRNLLLTMTSMTASVLIDIACSPNKKIVLVNNAPADYAYGM
jgi:hypothetical protein